MERTYTWFDRFCQRAGWWSRKDDAVDHGKMWGTIALVYIMVGVACGFSQLSVGMAIVIGSLAYGRSMWNRFLDSKIVTATANETTSKLVSQITENRNLSVKVDAPRDPVAGVQPWAGLDVPFLLPGAGDAAHK